jgi:hypothetical protein
VTCPFFGLDVKSYTFGGFIHILLILALAAVVIQIITGRQPL